MDLLDEEVSARSLCFTIGKAYDAPNPDVHSLQGIGAMFSCTRIPVVHQDDV